MKICVIGNGFIADHLNYHKFTDYFPVDSSYISNFLDQNKPDVLINCIGKTGRPNIDWCESNKEITTSINVALPILLAEQCAKRSIHMIHIGSGCIFFGQSPNINQSILDPKIIYDNGWKETDFANPKSFYSKTKYSCDLAIGDLGNVTILRIRMPISTKNNQRNLINKLRGYQNVINVPNSVTFVEDLVRCIRYVADNRITGVFHVTNPEPLTAADVMKEYKRYVTNHKFNIISEAELDNLTLAKRSNCILDSSKLNTVGFFLRPAQEALEECMTKYLENL
jgi:3,5-epimerase/4-reductase